MFSVEYDPNQVMVKHETWQYNNGAKLTLVNGKATSLLYDNKDYIEFDKTGKVVKVISYYENL